jgi:redox-sensitive bicupin YhaK (pirin superfamily)
VTLEIITPRDVPLGGPRAMTVRRTLPTRSRTLVGPWCFVDHYGPDRVASSGGMLVPPHPHTGLQTVSWLFEGEIEHRDTTGAHGLVRPGEVNLMTAGHGVAHSEVSTASTDVLHGAQLWLALPDVARSATPAFEHHVPDVVELGAARLRVFVGSYAGAVSPVRTYSPALGVEVVVAQGARAGLPLDAVCEHALLVDRGPVSVDGEMLDVGELGHLAAGTDGVELIDASGAGARLLLLGGAPFGEEILMWWNFVARTHEEIVEQRDAWQARSSRFGDVAGYVGDPQWLPAPELPHARLRPRTNPVDRPRT